MTNLAELGALPRPSDFGLKDVPSLAPLIYRSELFLQGVGEPCSLKTLSNDVLVGNVKDHQNVQHIPSSCWMPVWLAFRWQGSSVGEAL